MIILKEFFESFLAGAADWCQGRRWQLRLPLLIGFAYILFRYWTKSGYSDILGWLNWGIHELGHMIFSFLGLFMKIAGGTIFQLFAPFYGMFNFWRQEDYFSIVLCFGWLSCNLFGVAAYIADARTMILPMAVPFYTGGNVIHDWNYLLTRMGLLRYDLTLAFFVRFLASISMLICLVFGAWLLVQMKVTKGKKLDVISS